MKKEDSCPVELKTTNKKLIRINAFVIFVLILIYLITQNPYVIGFVTLDFMIKVLFTGKYSPLTRCINFILSKAKIESIMIDAWPKIFAARIGLILSIIILMFYLFDLNVPAMVFSIIFLIASGLEAFFDFCIACMIYPYFKKIFK